jgi:hypothetical protein
MPKTTGGIVGIVHELEIADGAISSPKIASPGIARIYHGPSSGSPAVAQYAGAIYFCTDTGKLGIWDGAAWKQVTLT